jgi:hypothetical protein
MDHYEELLALAKRLEGAAATARTSEFEEPTERLRQAVELVGRAASGSWLGYQANIYYASLRPPPPGAHFSQEWGLEELFGNMGSSGDWREFDPEAVRAHLHQLAGNPDLTAPRRISQAAVDIFSAVKAEALSILELELANGDDAFLRRLKLELEKLKPASIADAIAAIRPQGQFVSRDMVALTQGFRTPPHLGEAAEVIALGHNVGLCVGAADILTRAGSHLERKRRKSAKAARVGTNVFIGHGRSAAWRELKDFVQDRAALPWDEFNRVPVAGVTNIARLAEMLDAAAIAFLVMTGEDEMADGGVQARMNVVHEAGLFQGRLGFSKAIVLLEEGCAEFSNIQGLGQIRFPKARISAVFEEVRRVLEREGLIDA